jgi:hypothetical protein
MAAISFTVETSTFRSLVPPPRPDILSMISRKAICRFTSRCPHKKLIVLFMSLTGGVVGLFAPIGVVKWIMQAEPEDAGILTLFFFPVWCLLVVLGLLIGRRLGLLLAGGKRVLRG